MSIDWPVAVAILLVLWCLAAFVLGPLVGRRLARATADPQEQPDWPEAPVPDPTLPLPPRRRFARRRRLDGAYASVLLQRLVDEGCRILGVERGCLWVRDRADASVVVAVVGHGVDPDVVGRRFPAEGVLAEVLAVGKPVSLAPDHAGASHPPRGADPTDQPPGLRRVRRGATVPLLFEGEALGALSVGSADPDRRFGRRELRMLDELADLAAAAVRDAELGRGLERAMDSGFELLASGLDACDPDAARRAEEVTELACAVAEGMGLGAVTCLELNLATRLLELEHSPRATLRLPAGETLDRLLERRGTRGPTEAGPVADVWSIVPGLEVVAMIVRHRDERWDGGGSPDRLEGERIPVASRILRVCEILAMAAAAGVGTNAALGWLRSGAGSGYDPAVVAEAEALVRHRARASAMS